MPCAPTMPIVTLGDARADTGSSSPALMPLHMSAEGFWEVWREVSARTS